MSKFDRGNTSFSAQLLREFNRVNWDVKYSKLKYYQNIVRHYMNLNVNSRGLLLYWGLGMGKSLGAIAIAMDQIENNGRSVIVLVAKSLVQNMRDTIHKYVRLRAEIEPSYFLAGLEVVDLDRWIEKHFGFAAFSANNMAKQLAKLSDQGDEESYLEEMLDNRIGSALDAIHLEGKLLIIDEVHNWSRAVTNGSKNSTMLYNAILGCQDLKCVFLTGTPIVNIPYEISILMNALGYIDHDILPQNWKDFTDAFVDEHTRSIINREKFQNRIMGFVSHVVQPVGSTDFPERLEMVVERVHMTESQYALYSIAREKERREQSFGVGTSSGISVPRGQSSSTYRVHSRELSNCVVGDSANSPKFVCMYGNIEAHAGIGLVYSQFTNDGGLGSLVKFLDAQGWTLWSDNGVNKYALITGKIATDQRSAIVRAFNSYENISGALIRLLLVSSTGAEGLDLKNVRHIHILEPYWNWSRIKQVEARGIRHGSHVALPLDQRNVQPYIYLAIEPEGEKVIERSTDEDMYWKSIDRMILNDQFTSALEEVSIECGLTEGKKCRVCEPNNKPLYWTDITEDLKHADTCKLYVSAKISGSKTVFEGVEYYYVKNEATLKGYDIYSKDSRLDKYVKLKYWDPLYSSIISTLPELSQNME